MLTKYLLILLALVSGTALSSCSRTGQDVWEDTKSSGRHMSRGLSTLCGKHGESRAVQNKDEFMPLEDECYINNSTQTSDFIPLADQMGNDGMAMGEFVSQQPSETPGEAGSSIPGIHSFKDPSTIPGMGRIFQNIRFDYNSNLVKGKDNLTIVRDVANYMRQHPNVYVFIEGHCDERGPEAYNLALGSRRANAVRNMLIQEGANPDNLFTISYGKERPLIAESNEESWAANRRAEFKIYKK